MGPYPQDGILEFDYEEVEEFVSKLKDTIDDLEDDLEEMEKIKADLQGVANSRAIMNYGEYNVDIADYKDTIEFYEAIADDLQEFLDEVDEQAKFTREPNFYYDDQLIEEIEDLTEETEDLRNDNAICIADREYTPFGPFERGNFFHKGSDEEQLIDHNDGRMEQWAEEINGILGDLVESAEEVERLHKLYFEDISINDWKKSHDWHDGITEHSREIHNIGAITTTMMNLGTILKSSYNANMGSEAKPIRTSATDTSIVDDYTEMLRRQKQEEKTLIGGVESTGEISDLTRREKFKSSYEIPIDSETGYTKSSLKLGRDVHGKYYLDTDFKEFRLPSGKRIDYLDFENGIVYELKPNNPNQVKAAEKQLQTYIDELNELGKVNPKYDKIWTGIIDTY